MKLVEWRERTPARLAPLLTVWETSVRATHLFLSEHAILEIRGYVPQTLAEVPHLLVAEEEVPSVEEAEAEASVRKDGYPSFFVNDMRKQIDVCHLLK